MSTTHEDKSSDKPRQRGRKGGPREPKAGREKKSKPDQRDGGQVDAMIASTSVQGGGPAAAVEQVSIGEAQPAEIAERVMPADISPTEATTPASDHPQVNLQTIANACRDYTRNSLLENRSYVEKLMSVRSLDKAVEVQAEFATQAYANFVAQSQRIFGLYGELARQSVQSGKRQA